MNRYEKMAAERKLNDVALDVIAHLRNGGKYGLWEYDHNIEMRLTKRYKSYEDLLNNVSNYYAYDNLIDLLDDVYDLRKV